MGSPDLRADPLLLGQIMASKTSLQTSQTIKDLHIKKQTHKRLIIYSRMSIGVHDINALIYRWSRMWCEKRSSAQEIMVEGKKEEQAEAPVEDQGFLWEA